MGFGADVSPTPEGKHLEGESFAVLSPGPDSPNTLNANDRDLSWLNSMDQEF